MKHFSKVWTFAIFSLVADLCLIFYRGGLDWKEDVGFNIFAVVLLNIGIPITIIAIIIEKRKKVKNDTKRKN